jgi:hypothetical protein
LTKSANAMQKSLHYHPWYKTQTLYKKSDLPPQSSREANADNQSFQLRPLKPAMLVAIFLQILYRNSYWIRHLTAKGEDKNWFGNLPLYSVFTPNSTYTTIHYGTVKASNFGPHGNFGLFLASSVASVHESCMQIVIRGWLRV